MMGIYDPTMHIFASYEDIETMVTNGDFEENHVLEAKRETTLGNAKKNIETAKDLAQFAFEGGTVVYGIDEQEEDGKTTFSMHPVQLEKGIEERIEQIAQTRCRPPLPVRVRTMPQSEGSDQGCIVVEVPPSSRRPHMVDGRYPRRGEKTVEFLSDADVRMWVSQSEDAAERVRAVLREHVAADPYPSGDRRTAHLFGVAVPLTSRHDDLPAARGMHQLLLDAANAHSQKWISRFAPNDRRVSNFRGSTSLRHANLEQPRHAERSLRTNPLYAFESEGADIADSEGDLAEWVVEVNGGIRVYDAGLSSLREIPRSGEMHVIWRSSAVEVAGILIESARMSAERLGYHGEWGFGLAATGMKGGQVHSEDFFQRFPVVDRDGFETIRIKSGFELESDTDPILDSLVGPVMRMLGSESYLESS